MPKKQKSTPNVWVLSITEGVDDYKPRGCSASSTIEVCSTEEKCLNRLYNITLDKMIEDLNEMSGEQTTLLDYANKLKDLGYLKCERRCSGEDDGGEEWIKTKEVSGIFPHFDEIMECITKAEFILCRWSYDITPHEVQ